MTFHRARVAAAFAAFAAFAVVGCTDADTQDRNEVVPSATYTPGHGFTLDESDRSVAAELDAGGELFVEVDDVDVDVDVDVTANDEPAQPLDAFTTCRNGTYRWVPAGTCRVCYNLGTNCVSSPRSREQYCLIDTWYNLNKYRCGSV